MPNYDLSKVLPHKKPMILIDDILTINLAKKTLTATVEIKDDSLFFDKSINGISSVLGIEYMAQTIGCYAYFKNNQKTPNIGFLLGTRLYNNALAVFEKGENFNITVTEIFTNDQIIAFDCIIFNKDNEEIASGTLNVYQNENSQELTLNNG